MPKKKIGNFPFTKGIYKDMYRTKLWTMRQYSGFSSVKESNSRFLSLLDSGVSGLSVAFDLPTQIGYDSDHEISYGEIGKSGVPISTIDDMKLLFNNALAEIKLIGSSINTVKTLPFSIFKLPFLINLFTGPLIFKSISIFPIIESISDI